MLVKPKMKERLILDGIIPAMNIPFDNSNKVDYESLRNEVVNGIEAGVVGFMIPVFVSEVSNLQPEEKRKIVEIVVETTEGQVPVIGGTTSGSLLESLRLAEDYMKKGCKSILCAIPYTDDKQYKKYAEALASLEPEFLMIQDWATGDYGVPIEVIIELFEELECFRCLKIEVVPAGPKYTEILKKTNGKLHVSGGWAISQMIEGLDRGVHAFAVTNMLEIYCCIVELYHKGERSKAKYLFEKLLPAIVFSNQHLDISIWFYKRLAWKQRLFKTPNVRMPIMNFDEYHRRVADEHIDFVISLTNRVISGKDF